jgi:ankyrin repeat protein
MNFVLRSSLFVLSIVAIGCAGFFDEPKTPLQRAAFAGDVAAVKALVAGGAAVNARDALGNTALAWAARGGHPVGPHRCRGEAADRADTIAALLALGADPNLPDTRPRGFWRASGWTPLFVALHHEQFALARVLLEHGADPNIRSDQGLSVMEMAAGEGAPRELLALMLEKGFDPRKAQRPR